MNKEKEALLHKIRFEKDTPHNVSKQSILRWIERMLPQDDDMRTYLFSYFSAPTLKEKQALKAAKLASLSIGEQSIFLEKWWKCVENDMSYNEVSMVQ
jgi:hypothetical protein